MKTSTTTNKTNNKIRKEILDDYQLAFQSRQASLIGRKEVFSGKAKFGIFGDGKEVAQLAMAKVFRKGDFRSGYYRDQTFMFAIGQLTIEQYFAQLYADPELEHEPASAGRLMNGHFGTRMLKEDGSWKKLTDLKNSSSDVSPTGSQMPRLVGLAYASKLYRENKKLKDQTRFSINGNEIAFGTIGNASTSEGMFFEAMNAAGVLQIPFFISVWDDEYGISVHSQYQTTKGDISKILAGFQRTANEKGFEIFKVKGWDYAELCKTYAKAEKICREQHIPVLVHVIEMTQPQGHSTSGSHERYKSKERLVWEDEHDCIKKMRTWIIENEIGTEEEIQEIEKQSESFVKEARNKAWKNFIEPIKKEVESTIQLIEEILQTHPQDEIEKIKNELEKISTPIRADIVRSIKKIARILRNETSDSKNSLLSWLESVEKQTKEYYNSYLYSQSAESAFQIKEIKPIYEENAPFVDGREVVRACFDAMLTNNPRVFAIGEDVGKIGDVNQGFAGLQEKYGELRVTDTGIRECTIIGQGIGAAMRGLRPITEIQYLDYLLYAIQILSDDLATLHYRTKGGQKAPLIIRTRGHRLEGVWHSGSPMGMILNSIRGIHVLVPRDMTQAAGFYNTMLQSDEPALIIECLNGYRLKEKIPTNIASFTVPIGIPEILKEGKDITIVTYGSMCRVVMDAAIELEEISISCEVIDVQSLLPFDINGIIIDSLKKTNKIIFTDEDVPGGTTAYMMQQVIEKQNGYYYLDAKPVTITGKEHRPAYASDGDYFSKPNMEDIFDAAYSIMSELDPDQFPTIY